MDRRHVSRRRQIAYGADERGSGTMLFAAILLTFAFKRAR